MGDNAKVVYEDGQFHVKNVRCILFENTDRLNEEDVRAFYADVEEVEFLTVGRHKLVSVSFKESCDE